MNQGNAEPRFWARLEAHGAFMLDDKFEIVFDGCLVGGIFA